MVSGVWGLYEYMEYLQGNRPGESGTVAPFYLDMACVAWIYDYPVAFAICSDHHVGMVHKGLRLSHSFFFSMYHRLALACFEAFGK